MQIIKCPKCAVKNRIASYSNTLNPICGRCGAKLFPTNQTESASQNTKTNLYQPLIMIALLVAIVFGITITPSLMRKDFSSLIEAEAQKTENLRKRYEEDLAANTALLEEELAAIDVQDLRQKATRNYRAILESRKSFDTRFALSPREKTQLQMLNLSSDSTKSFHKVIRSVAKEASPAGADISVFETLEGVALHIDFEMSSMTSGERGTRTKHLTKDSMKKEVISLISRVTNDIFQFSLGLNISSIYIGCHHFVDPHESNSSTEEYDMLLYKIGIQKSEITQLTNDPFLDVYSTSKYFDIEEDNFNEITIRTSRL